MKVKVKTHKRKRKNGVAVVRQHSRKGTVTKGAKNLLSGARVNSESHKRAIENKLSSTGAGKKLYGGIKGQTHRKYAATYGRYKNDLSTSNRKPKKKSRK